MFSTYYGPMDAKNGLWLCQHCDYFIFVLPGLNFIKHYGCDTRLRALTTLNSVPHCLPIIIRLNITLIITALTTQFCQQPTPLK